MERDRENEVALAGAIPILRIFDERVARDFYLGYLGFTVDWEHRFGDDFPLYCPLSRSQTVLHLSAHHGDDTGHAGKELRWTQPQLSR